MSEVATGNPKLSQWLAFARSQGCLVQTGYARSRDGFIETMTRVTTPDQRKNLVIVGIAQSEELALSTVDRNNRRLDLDSSLFIWQAETNK